MNILSVLGARSTWLFDLSDINPRGRGITDELILWLKNTYKFDVAPASLKDLDQTSGLAFKNGIFRADESSSSIAVELTIYRDGIIANTWSSTRETDGFIQHVLASATREFGLTFHPDMVRVIAHVSELAVRLDQQLSKFSVVLDQFAQRITAKCDQRGIPPFELSGLSFWSDTSALAFKVAPFTLERRLGAPFQENRFYAKAPMQTEDHLALLSELEEILRKPN